MSNPQMRLSIRNNRVLLDFGELIQRLGLNKEQARALGQALLKHAEKLAEWDDHPPCVGSLPTEKAHD